MPSPCLISVPGDALQVIDLGNLALVPVQQTARVETCDVEKVVDVNLSHREVALES